MLPNAATIILGNCSCLVCFAPYANLGTGGDGASCASTGGMLVSVEFSEDVGSSKLSKGVSGKASK